MVDNKGGRISRIKMKNFMTYDEMEIKPIRGLNLILGLNGSGKSSIMSAICLGLAGKPQFIGRSTQLTEFIKFDRNKAVIEIELETDLGGKAVIRRVIQPDKTTWHLNSSQVQQSEIVAIVKKYNIDMGNLCQFLPQEKVAEFSRMDKKQRLENMIQTIGEPRLAKLFVDLKNLRRQFCQVEKELGELENSKNVEVQTNERIKHIVDEHDTKLKLQLELNILRVQKMGLEYNRILTLNKTAKEQKKNLRDKLARVDRELTSLRERKDCLLSDSNEHNSEIGNLKRASSKCVEILTKYSENLNVLHEQIDKAKIDYRNRITEKEEQRVKLTEMRRQIKGLKQFLEQMKTSRHQWDIENARILKEFEETKHQLSSLDPKMERMKLDINRFEFEKKTCIENMRKISNEEGKKYEILRQRYPDAYKAVQWLNANKSSFKATISPPALVSINVQENGHRVFIENAISGRDLLMFVCEDKDDLQRFLHVVKTENKWNVNVAMVPDETLSDFRSPPITSEMRRLGIECFLNELFTAPEPVMRYLCKLMRLHQVPVCNVQAEKNIERLIAFNSVFFTPVEKINGKRSQYGNKNLSVVRRALVTQGILPNVQNNSQDLRSYEEKAKAIDLSLRELQDQYKIYENDRKQLEKKQEHLRGEKNNLSQEARKVKEAHVKLWQLTESYERKEREVIDDEEEKAKVTQLICNKNMEKMNILSEMHKQIKNLLNLKKEKTKKILIMKLFSSRLSLIATELNNKEAEYEDVKKKFLEKAAEHESLKAKGQELWKGIQESEHQNALKKLFVELSKNSNKPGSPSIHANSDLNLENVENQIINIETQLSLNEQDTDPIVTDFKKREQQIETYEQKIEQLKARIQGIQRQIHEKKNDWLIPLKTHVENINKKFSEYYKFLNCAGEISLDTTEDEDDFPNYGLQIKLKYRIEDDGLTELSSSYHSGGECSVAAIIFILSLQELTEVPFRCIDEINQGMDSINERKIYQLVADAAKSGSCSQYFLLTPKLLTDLSYHKDVAVHIIFNSAFLHTKLDVKKHLEIAG